MLRKLPIAILILLIVAGGFLISRSFIKKKLQGPSLYIYHELPKDLLARSGEFTVPLYLLQQDVYYKFLLKKREELQRLMAYQQFALTKKGIKHITFGHAEPERPWKSVCVQYGVSCDPKTQISYANAADFLIDIDGERHAAKELKQNNIYWLGVDSEIFQYALTIIKRQLINQALSAQAKQQNLKIQDLRKQIVDSYGPMPEDPNKASLAEDQRLFDHLQRQGLKLPIEVALTPPSHEFDLKYEWTPNFGEPKADIRVLFIADFFSDASRRLLVELPALKARWPKIFFAFMPFALNDDPFQRVAAELSLCVWTKDPDKLWPLLALAPSFGHDTVETDMYKALEQIGAKIEPIKQCFLTRQVKEAYDYHLNYANYLGIKNAPVLFIGGEVFIGPLGMDQVEEILSRQAGLPASALWLKK